MGWGKFISDGIEDDIRFTKNNCYFSPWAFCIYVAPWPDILWLHWYVIGIGLAIFGLCMVKVSLRWLAGIAYGLVGWHFLGEVTGWHPLPYDDFVALVGYLFCLWLFCYIDGQDKKKPPEAVQEWE